MGQALPGWFGGGGGGLPTEPPVELEKQSEGCMHEKGRTWIVLLLLLSVL